METLVLTLTGVAGGNPDYIQKFKLTPKPLHILLTLPDESEFGLLRDNMKTALESFLRQYPVIELEAVGHTTQLRNEISRASKPEEALVHVNINIYGPEDRAKEVGDELSKHKLWLQRPDNFKAQFPYRNPHALHFKELEGLMVEEEMRKELSTVSKPRALTEENRLNHLVREVEKSLTRANELGVETGDRRLNTGLLK
jgi:SWI/SNF-related matrix-associated actin-dependent regulator of chromatin subfamily A3